MDSNHFDVHSKVTIFYSKNKLFLQFLINKIIYFQKCKINQLKFNYLQQSGECVIIALGNGDWLHFFPVQLRQRKAYGIFAD